MQRVGDVEQWFYKALEKPPETRRHYLDTELKEDPELLKSVLKLLEYEQHEESLFTRLASQVKSDSESEDTPTIDRYDIKHEISRGGMAVVYLARRKDGLYDQDVAVKILKSSMISEDILLSFHKEKNVLARLQHPNIAQIFDAGIASDGRPYFIMEYIDGKQLPEHASSAELSGKEKLRLFLSICEAVQHAHQHLIIHGDIKPSNILIRENGQVKLTDFGIAQLLEEDTTQQPGRLLTPEYASPEQAAGEILDIRSDIYQLGKVLKSLIQENTPEINHIACKATTEEKLDRYQSVDQLIEDIRNYLATRPISAMPGKPGYGLWLFARRNKWQVAISGLALLLLMVVSFVYVRNITEARRIAENKEAKASETLNFLLGLFEESDPTVNLGDSVDIGKLLSSGQVKADLIHDEEIKAAIYNTLGKVRLSLGNYLAADSLLKKAHKSYLATGNQAGVGEVLINSGILEEKRQNLNTSRLIFAEAFALIENDQDKLKIYSHLARQYDLSHPDTAAVIKKRALNLVKESNELSTEDKLIYTYELSDIGYAQLMRSATDSVINLKIRLIRSMERINDTNLAAIASMYGNLAMIYSSDNRYDSSLVFARKNLELLTRMYGQDNIHISSGLKAMAQTHGWNGTFDSARHYAERSLKIKKEWFGDLHPAQLPERQLLAQLLASENHFEKAEKEFRINYELSKVHYGLSNKITGDNLFQLLQHLNTTGKFDESIDFYPELIKTDSLTYGMSSNTATSILDYGQALARIGRKKEALIQLESALAIYRADEGPEDFLCGMTLFSIARVHRDSAPELAISYMDSAITIIEKDMPENHPRIGNYQQQYASLLASQHQYKLSNRYYEKAIDNYRFNYSKKSPERVAKFQRYYAKSLRKQGLYDSAIQVENNAKSILSTQKNNSSSTNNNS
ncbi:MAG: serine/threonine-protein kinase [Cyclobacteriaceae bacterium]